jgi:hypothetical protein
MDLHYLIVQAILIKMIKEIHALIVKIPQKI